MTLKENDVIEVSLIIVPLIPEEDKDKPDINLDDYDTFTSITYMHSNTLLANVAYREDPGYSSYSDIKNYLEQYLKDDITEIDEYELFDVDNVNKYQTAKIRIKSVKRK